MPGYLTFESQLNGAGYSTSIIAFRDGGQVGIGTTSPQWSLQVSSSTRSQLTLSDPSSVDNNHWSFRNAGGKLYIATSSATTFATSTNAPSVSIITSTASGGNTLVGIGKANPAALLDISGNGDVQVWNFLV